MPTLEQDLAAIFASDPISGASSGSFDTEPETVVNGRFSKYSGGLDMYGNQIEGLNATFTGLTSELESMAEGQIATIGDVDYVVKRIQDCGTGVTTLYLKTKRG